MAGSPHGTVAFLFTDVEGSTALWERDRAAMAAAVARHLALLRSAVEAHGGTLFKVVGDAVQTAFPDTPSAVAAAVDAQRALAAEAWGETGPLRVRMAIHAGEAAPDARGDYLAPALNRLARLLAAGHGDQILLSQAAQLLARDALPPGARLRDLGEHRLRDLLEPERIFQALHPDLPDAFPPLRTLEARPNNLPRQPTALLGRGQEMADVAELLRQADVHLLTLTGPAGTGKTRLALQVAADCLDEFDDGVFFVPLAPLADPRLVPDAIATAVGVRGEAGRSLDASLRSALASKRLLLLLDNFEHVLEAAPFLGELLAACPLLKVLATSRAPLRLRAEREYAVPPLGLPPRTPPPSPGELCQYAAVRLFIERARAVRADFAVDDETAPVVAEICRRLDGLPLAIELAAARIRMLPPETLLTRLEKRLSILTGGARDAPARQRTLRDAIAWSHDLLDEEERDVFRRLAVFAGGLTLEAAEAVVDPDGGLDVFGGLERLCEHSLLRAEDGPDGEARFAMLETVLEFALEQLAASGEGDVVRRRHAEWCLDLAEQAEAVIFGAEQRRWVERLEREHPNLRAALAWFLEKEPPDHALRLAGALFLFWFIQGHLAEGTRWLERAIARGEEAAPDLRAWAHFGAGILVWGYGDAARAEAFGRQGLALSKRHDLAFGAALSLYLLHLVASSGGQPAESIPLGEEAIDLIRQAGNQTWLAYMLGDVGLALAQTGDNARGTAMIEEGLALHTRLGNKQGAGNKLSDLAVFRHDQGDLERAARHYAESVRLLLESGDRWYLGGPLAGIAALAAGAGRAKEAARLLGVAEACWERGTGGLWPKERERLQETTAYLQGELGEEAYRREVAAGRAMPLEEAVAMAVALVADLPTSQDGAASPSARPVAWSRGGA